MSILIVTNNPDDWPFEVEGVDVVDAWSYLTGADYSTMRGAKVFNLCRSYRYQTTGYYVSLLAEARGHKPLPSIVTLQDMKSPSMVRIVADELDELIQKSLAPLHSQQFILSVYFGRNLAHRYDRLSLQLFNQFQAPLLRFSFAKRDKWLLRSVKAISGNEVPIAHRPFVAEAAKRHFSGRNAGKRKSNRIRYDLAILHDPSEAENAPSDPRALERFVKSARSIGLEAELITRDDAGRLLEFGALFIRETTQVNHHTYRFARKAAAEGLVVIDDPISIARCTNKVYVTELLRRHNIPTPRSIVVHRDNVDAIGTELGFPCVLKKPDSSFSQGVVKLESSEVLHERLKEFFGESDLLLAQEFLPTSFDWRIGVLDRKPIYACKYHMAPGHWQIIQQSRHGRGRYGKSETMPVEVAPRKAVSIAVKAANLIGDGLYGVDVKQVDNRFYIIEINDNPNIDAGVEDAVLRDELYLRIMNVFLQRIEQRKARFNE